MSEQNLKKLKNKNFITKNKKNCVFLFIFYIKLLFFNIFKIISDFLVKWSIFAVLVCASHKDPIAASDFDRLYLKKIFEFLQNIKTI